MRLVLAENATPGAMPSAMHVPVARDMPRETPTAASLALDDLVMETFAHWRAGRISETERDRRLTEIDAQRSAIATPGGPPRKRKFARRPYQRSPDRQASRELRARVAADYDAIPSHIRCLFAGSEAGAAVMVVIARAHQCHGQCDWYVEKIAAKGGVSVRSVQYALKRAAKLGLIDPHYERRIPGAKSRTNVIRIIAADWLAWLAPRRGGIGCKTFPRAQNFAGHEAKTSRQSSEAGGVEEFPRVARILRVSG
jgi:hypothetical protein